jgi:hypothetical protein
MRPRLKSCATRDGPTAARSAVFGPAAVAGPRDGRREHNGSADVSDFRRDILDQIGQRVARADIHHAPWPLQPADANIRVNTMADAAGIRLPGSAPLLHFAKRQDTVAWLPFPGSSHVPVLP